MHNQIIHPFLRSYETRLSDHDVKRGCDHNPPHMKCNGLSFISACNHGFDLEGKGACRAMVYLICLT